MCGAGTHRNVVKTRYKYWHKCRYFILRLWYTCSGVWYSPRRCTLHIGTGTAEGRKMRLFTRPEAGGGRARPQAPEPRGGWVPGGSEVTRALAGSSV